MPETLRAAPASRDFLAGVLLPERGPEQQMIRDGRTRIMGRAPTGADHPYQSSDGRSVAERLLDQRPDPPCW